MERMPYQEHAGADAVISTAAPVAPAAAARNDWRNGLPTLTGSLVTLRELRPSDARSLFIALTDDEVTRFISPPPSTVQGFETFIAWTGRQRIAGQYVCFAIVPRDSDTAIGLFQMRSLETDFAAAEWGFAVSPEFWATGVFSDGAQLTIGFAFETLGAHRLEARASVANGRGNAALHKLGATREGVLRKSFLRHGEYHDQALWTLLADEWLERERTSASPGIH
ncbi:MAG: acetyltransferase [Acidobacteria bacterium]|nr:acetyltransferase [Acidobacteriota bacterium]